MINWSNDNLIDQEFYTSKNTILIIQHITTSELKMVCTSSFMRFQILQV